MKKILFLVGPTASGKTEVAIRLARYLSAEIISADSMQIYRSMDIGTDKPSIHLRKQIKHYLLDICSTSRSFSVFGFRKRALDAIRKIEKNNRLPLVVGGSGLYVKALLDGLSPQPGANSSLRQELQKLAREKGLDVLYERLKQVDPSRAQRVHKNDARRIIRAMEIYEASGQSMSEWEKQTVPLKKLGYDFRLYGLRWNRDILYQRVQERVDRMIRKGLVKEVKRLSRRKLSKTARQAVGYKELFTYIEGNKTLEEAKTDITKNTRHLVKRQLTWFRNDKRICWITMNGKNPIQTAVAKIKKDVLPWLRN